MNVVQAIIKNDVFIAESLILNNVRCLLSEIGCGMCCYVQKIGNMTAHMFAKYALLINCPRYCLKESSECISHIILAICYIPFNKKTNSILFFFKIAFTTIIMTMK